MGASTRPVWAVEDGAVYDGPFRANIGAFLGHFGCPVLLRCSSWRAWTIDVVDVRQDSAPPTQLYVYEDIATPEEPPVCDQCRIIGAKLESETLSRRKLTQQGKACTHSAVSVRGLTRDNQLQ